MVYDLQKADTWKRVSAFIFDKILVFVLAVGIAFLFSLVLDFDKYSDMYNKTVESYSEKYSVDLSISEEEYNKLSDADKKQFDDAYNVWVYDQERNYAISMILNLSLIVLIISSLVAYSALEFAVPLFIGNGQTVGKKIFGVAVMRIDGVKVSPFVMFARAILGKYTLELMLPLLLLLSIFYTGVFAPIIPVLIVLVNAGFTIFTKNHTPLHDLLASTVTVDMATQLIFDSPEALLDYKQKIHAEMADRAEY